MTSAIMIILIIVIIIMLLLAMNFIGFFIIGVKEVKKEKSKERVGMAEKVVRLEKENRALKKDVSALRSENGKLRSKVSLPNQTTHDWVVPQLLCYRQILERYEGQSPEPEKALISYPACKKNCRPYKETQDCKGCVVYMETVGGVRK